MRILTRYVLREIFSFFLIGLLVFSFVIYIRPLSHLLELLTRHTISPGKMALLFLLPVPSLLTYTIPMAVLLGTLMGLSRMAADGEVVAVRAAGIGRSQFIRPVLIFAGLGWLLTSGISLSLAPAATRKLAHLEARLVSSQASFEVQPRVFLEQFPQWLFYIHDISESRQFWRGIFVAHTGPEGILKVTFARRGDLASDPATHQLTLHLTDGTTHELDAQQPNLYSVISFASTDIPIEQREAASSERLRPEMLTVPELLRQTSDPVQARAAWVQINYRLALPFAALVLALVGIPLGLVTHKGGKHFGLMVTIALVFLYYILMATGMNFAKQGRLSPAAGLWMANFIFGACAIFMLAESRRLRTHAQILEAWIRRQARHSRFRRPREAAESSALAARPKRRGRRFQVLDGYVLRSWLFFLALLVAVFIGIYMIFDFFQLLGDVVRNHIPLFEVLKYYEYLTPQVLYLMLPLGILMATLVTFGLLSKRNEITAVKALGVSLYRLSAPVLAASCLLSGGMFLLGNNYLPASNQQQDSLRNTIKGKPPQTSYRPGQQWIFGQSDRIYNYRYFDPARDVFANLSVFELSPDRFQVVRRIYAERAFWQNAIHSWVLENGWVRDLDGGKVTAYRTFALSMFSELTEPPDYFKTEVKPSEQMSAGELRRYIQGLQQSGFDVVSLWVAFYNKFSYPLIALVVALLGIPFAFATGRRGALSGVAISFAIAIAFWSLSSVFDAMGNLGQLPPTLAAWSPDVLFGLAGIYLILRMRT